MNQKYKHQKKVIRLFNLTRIISYTGIIIGAISCLFATLLSISIFILMPAQMLFQGLIIAGILLLLGIFLISAGVITLKKLPRMQKEILENSDFDNTIK
jgi:hypothetical protein